MAILDTEYVKAPSLRAGDLSITKSSTGFRMFEGDTVFLTGSADGTLTIGKENLTSSIPALHINAEEVYWNNKPLKDYWEEEAGPDVPDLTQDVTELQELTAANTQAIQNTDKRLSQEIADLRMDALGAEINTLVSPINGFVSDIRGVAIPATILKESLPYFNRITINNVQSTGTGYLAIYSCDATTPAVSSPCTLLYVVEGVFETTGSQTAPASSTIEIPEKITVPDDGLIILIFANSTTAPQTDNISWVATENSTMSMRLGIYSPGGTNRPYDTNGEYVLQKVANTFFITYSPDIDFSYVAKDRVEDEDPLSDDVEAIKSQIEDLRSDLGDYMTYEETTEAISTFPDDGLEGRLYPLGSLVDALTVPTLPLALSKKIENLTSSIEFKGDVLSMKSATTQEIENIGSYISTAELKLLSGIAQLTLNRNPLAYSDSGDIASLGMRAISSGYFEEGAIELKSIYRSEFSGSTAQVHLTTGSGRLELGMRDSDQDFFQLLAQAPTESYRTGILCLTYKSLENSSQYSELNITQYTAALSAHNNSQYAQVGVYPYKIELGTDSVGYNPTLILQQSGLSLSSTASSSTWNGKLDSTSTYIPTISIVHYLIQQSLAN